MPKRNVIKSGPFQGSQIKGDMPLIASVCKKDLKRLRPLGSKSVIQRSAYFSAVIAQAVHSSMQLSEINISRLFPKKWKHITAPSEIKVIGIRPDIVMISGDQHHFCMCQSGEKIIQFLQLTYQRLTVEQIPRDQQQIRFLFFTNVKHMLKCIPQLSTALSAVEGPRIGLRSKMYVRCMDKPHRLSPFADK